MGCFTWKDGLFGNVPPSCLSLPCREKSAFPGGQNTTRVSKSLGYIPGTTKYYRYPGWQYEALLQGGRSNSRDCFYLCSLSFLTQFLGEKAMINQIEKCWKLTKVSQSLLFSSFWRVEMPQHKQVAKRRAMRSALPFPGTSVGESPSHLSGSSSSSGVRCPRSP